MRIRINNDFRFSWAIERNGSAEDLSAAINMSLKLRDSTGRIQTISNYDITGNKISVDVTPSIANILGRYVFILTYELPDTALSDNERMCEIDTDAFIIVPRTAEADDSQDLLVTSDMAIGFKGMSSYQVWLDAGNTGTLEDYLADIKGDPFLYSDFTPEQLEALKVKGDKGDPFLYSDFTPEQLEALKGEQGADGVGLNYLGTVATSANLDPTYTGSANHAFVTEDLGRAWKWTGTGWLDVGSFRGEKGDPFTYDDFTPAQLEALKVKGDPFTYGDFTPEQLLALKGDKGDPFTYGDFTPEQLEALKVKGEKGDPFTYDDFTPAQLEALKVKGDKGDPFLYEDFTPEQIEALKVKGDKGDPLTYADLTEANKTDLRQPIYDDLLSLIYAGL